MRTTLTFCTRNHGVGDMHNDGRDMKDPMNSLRILPEIVSELARLCFAPMRYPPCGPEEI